MKYLRACILAMALLIPGLALADDAASLGPQTSSSSLNNSSGASSSDTGTLLQPSTTTGSPLQSADASGSGTSQAPIQNLQQTGSSDDAKLLVQGDADNSPQQLDSAKTGNWFLYVLAGLGALILIVGALIVFQGRRRA